MWTIINEMVDGCHQWKVTRINSKSASSTSTIIEYSGTSSMNFDISWIMNYGSSLREKEENFDNLCCESSQPTRGISRVRLTRFKQRWNEDESSSVHRETVAFTMRVKPRPPRKAAAAAAAAAAIPCQYIREQSQITAKERILRQTKLGLQFLDDRRAENIPSRLSSSSMSTSTPL